MEDLKPPCPRKEAGRYSLLNDQSLAFLYFVAVIECENIGSRLIAF